MSLNAAMSRHSVGIVSSLTLRAREEDAGVWEEIDGEASRSARGDVGDEIRNNLVRELADEIVLVAEEKVLDVASEHLAANKDRLLNLEIANGGAGGRSFLVERMVQIAKIPTLASLGHEEDDCEQRNDCDHHEHGICPVEAEVSGDAERAEDQDHADGFVHSGERRRSAGFEERDLILGERAGVVLGEFAPRVCAAFGALGVAGAAERVLAGVAVGLDAVEGTVGGRCGGASRYSFLL